MSAIGIDLGTTNSCVAVYRNGRVEVIANDSGSRVTPSCVSFTESERLIGQPAKDEASMNCENTLFQMKRLIGRKFNDTTVQEDLKLFAFKVLNDGNRPKIQVTYKEKKETFYPEQISAMILTELKGAAEAYMGEPITDAVITVPAYFNDAQRTATRDAGRIAGLNVLSTINEPTAAAIAYGLDRKGKEKRNVLIFDLGGGTFDVTVVTIEEEIFDVRATGGDTHLGGEDFDNKMVQYFMAEFNKKHNVDISKDKRSLSRLKIACELTKRNLSTATSAKLQVDALYNGLDLKTIVSQAKFEDINSEYFTSTITCVKNVLEDAKMKKEEIDDIVLVGGSTRIPNVRKLLQDYFNGKEICREINPDEAVAYGAAAHAQNIKLGGKETHGSFKLKDVTSLSIGTDVKGSDMHVVIPRNTKIPTQKMVGFTTGRDNQDIVPFMVFEGERPKVSDNHLLGCFLLKGIQPAPAGKPEILSIFKIDESGILSVTAIDLGSGNVNNIKISNQDRLKDEEIQKMIAAGEKFQLEDKEYKERTGAINELEGLVYKIKNLVEADTSTISPKDRKGLLAKAQEAIDWVEANKKADIKSIRLKTIELHKIFNAVRGFSAFLKTMSRLAELVRNESG